MIGQRPPEQLLVAAQANAFTRFEIDDGWLLLCESFFSPDEASRLLRQLTQETNWQQHEVKLFGKSVASPRLSSWHGLPEATYRYSGFSHAPQAFTPAMNSILTSIQQRLGLRFNSVLANLYRNGLDSMGLHADDEKELGDHPLIASLSLGARRRFIFRHRQVKGIKHELALTHGSLLLMGGTLQSFWKHEVPKEKLLLEARVNLTFRNVLVIR